MKRILTSSLWLISITSFAQIKLNVVAGYNEVNLTNVGKLPFTDYSYQFYHTAFYRYSSINSYHTGVAAEIPLGAHWSLEPALLYFGNGTDLNYSLSTFGGSYFQNTIINLYYLRLPVNLLYKIGSLKAFQFFAGAGFYWSRGLWGREKGEDSSFTGASAWTKQVIDDNIKFASQPPSDNTFIGYTPYDFGYTVLAGVEWKQFQVATSITNGLVRAFKGNGFNLWNSAFSVSLAYRLATL
jgi:hypothetical protein